MASPRTPVKSGTELQVVIDKINEEFSLRLPNPHLYSPSKKEDRDEDRLGWRGYLGIKRLYFSRSVNLQEVLNNFEDWVLSEYRPGPSRGDSSVLPRGMQMQLAAGGGGGGWLSEADRERRLEYLMKLIDDEIYLLNKGSFSPYTKEANMGMRGLPGGLSRPLKRRLSEEDEDEFHTAPNSPVKDGDAIAHSPALDLNNFEDPHLEPSVHMAKTPKFEERKTPSKFLEKLTAPDKLPRYDGVPGAQNGPEFSFSTTASSHLSDSRVGGIGASFTSNATDITEPMIDDESLYEDSVVGQMTNHDANMTFDTSQATEEYLSERAQYSIEGKIIDELLQNGPFASEQSFPASVPLRYRYELERIGRAWNVPFKQMLKGNNVSFNYGDFWKWIEGHNQRGENVLPEKPTRRAFDAAVGDFKTDKHSEVVVLTGDLDWCDESEPGILKLKLNPLKTEKTCRFHRRFGSDRFLSLTIPAPAQPPRHLRFTSHPTLLRETIALWLTQNVHRCLGRTWKPFYVAQVKSKRKSKGVEPRFKVEFFAIGGKDFDQISMAPPVAPSKQPSDRHTPMSLNALIEWHMPTDANVDESNCKLFQRISLGLSKTFATVSLKPRQVLSLSDAREPGGMKMNDGCALMSRSLAKEICDSLGISGNTPSCFQGRIAGAKGLWMVDKHQTHISADGDDRWIQISDSQLKIKPHPCDWREPVDEEKLTFEVVMWSKPPHPVDLNIQLLAILEHGGRIKEYVAELTRAGIQALYQDFAEVLQSNSNVLCRGLVQKIRPAADDGGRLMAHNVRRLEQWTANDTECIIRLTEAGFAPQSFYPLRKRLGRCLRDLLDRSVDELHIEVPLSTYAFCIADPYGVLNEDEVHFGLSNNWRDPNGQFEDNLLDGMDVLVGRLPAHLPSDIQRRRAVWKQELRHFKDVIVFPTRGKIALAHMLSGGDYDGDTPWICWDQNIVQNFYDTDLPTEEFPAEHFGLTKHSVPMREIHSMDEFLQSAFTFNMTLSNLGRCSLEHEKISYDESINLDKAKELACLLSHLVDGRKGGVHLSEPAWQQYRKRISPWARDLPAYRNPDRRYKKSNIIDYLKFEVARKAKHAVLEQLEQSFPEMESHGTWDEDLIRPWDEAHEIAETDKPNGLYAVLENVSRDVKTFHDRWVTSLSGEKDYSPVARDAVERVKTISPPSGDHPLIHTWQNSQHEWLRLLASCTYKRYSHSSFAIHAFGETLCQIKAATLPNRIIANEIVACYRVNQKVVSQLTAKEVPEEDEGEGDEYEGQEAVEAMMQGIQMPGGYYDLDDGISVE
ncbi:hypothetical protein ASPWEDRAFT_102291 [Aspergillus wentii DTO 134E9]|uniref:RNA-dependent RNA polymerase n=1 Tax=Aspergillus wentii DTO 134E9 TaxID=1073089 RepID=A0A1L9S3J5_ASPWE|nr:uncharacterized protein ASPWEDRAFT_102291 [Aspergillus wentii DTO 134E9]KAI9930061.1 hypothetical protein MW887_011871 [Aspergillus wentii]OJJ41724.1 hypothetical protein ASPWEDRAFT_102291 [Aspergillus wentii DTO 134E9]